MSITFTVNKAATTFRVSYRAFGPDGFGNYTFQTRRGFMSFDLSGEGISPGSIATAELILTATTIVGGGSNIELYTALDPDGFGATLDATEPDFSSSAVDFESALNVTTTGTKTWEVDPDHINATGVTYFCLRHQSEFTEVPHNTGSLYASQTNATVGSRPILRLTLSSGQVIFVNQTGGIL